MRVPRVSVLAMMSVLSIACADAADVSSVQRDGHALKAGIAVDEQTWLSAAALAAVGRMVDDVGAQRCTATLIAPRRLLTAGHCFAFGDDSVATRAQVLDHLWFDNGVAVVPIIDVSVHPDRDVAVATLGADVDGAVFAALPAALDAALVGSTVYVFGAGFFTPYDEVINGGAFVISDMTSTQLVLTSAGDAGLCPGDSGAPVFQVVDDTWQQVGVHVVGFDSCASPAHSERLDLVHAWLLAARDAPLPDANAVCEDEGSTACVDDARIACRNGYARVLNCAAWQWQCDELNGASQCLPMPCGDVRPAGRCSAGLLEVCLAGSLVVDDCTARAEGCGFDAAQGRNACLACTACDGVCVDHAVDAVHCGGCGIACSTRERCEAGQCRQRAAVDAGPEEEHIDPPPAPKPAASSCAVQPWSIGWLPLAVVGWRRRGVRRR